MPIYEYQCQSCEQVVERIQKFSDAPLKTCESCGGELKKLVSLSSFALKGSGWYTTDYKRAAPPQSSAHTSSTSSEPASTPVASGDAPSGESKGAAVPPAQKTDTANSSTSKPASS